MTELLSFEWLVLLLRVAFVALLYVFLFQVVRVTTRELVALARQTGRGASTAGPPRLMVIDDGGSVVGPGTTFIIGPRTTVGRHSGHDVVLDDQFVSGDHAELVYRGNQWWIVDLASTNGTFVNGAPVAGQQGIDLGDVVQFGRIKLRFAA